MLRRRSSSAVVVAAPSTMEAPPPAPPPQYSVGWNWRPGWSGARYATCCPDPDATSRTRPVGGRCRPRTSAMGPRFRAAAGEKLAPWRRERPSVSVSRGGLPLAGGPLSPPHSRAARPAEAAPSPPAARASRAPSPAPPASTRGRVPLAPSAPPREDLTQQPPPRLLPQGGPSAGLTNFSDKAATPKITQGLHPFPPTHSTHHAPPPHTRPHQRLTNQLLCVPPPGCPPGGGVALLGGAVHRLVQRGQHAAVLVL